MAVRTITEMQPNITKDFDRDVWTAAVNDVGYTVTRPASRRQLLIVLVGLTPTASPSAHVSSW